MSPSRAVWTLMINWNRSKDGFKPCAEKPTTTSSEDFFSPVPSNPAKTQVRSPSVLLLFRLKYKEIPSVLLLTVPRGLQAQPGCRTLGQRYYIPSGRQSAWAGARELAGVGRQWSRRVVMDRLIRHGTANVLWHRRMMKRFVGPGIISLISWLVALKLLCSQHRCSRVEKAKKKKKKENNSGICASGPGLSSLRVFPRGQGCSLFWWSVYWHSQKVSGRRQVDASPVQKVKQKGGALKLEANLWDL